MKTGQTDKVSFSFITMDLDVVFCFFTVNQNVDLSRLSGKKKEKSPRIVPRVVITL